jgi:hypothetical protein
MINIFNFRIRSFFVVGFIGFLFSLSACSKENTTTVQASAGKMIGTIQTWDDKTISTNDAGGISIVLNNLTGFSSSTTTDASGKFLFENLPYDVYDMVISKAGYGTLKVFGISHTSSSSSLFTLLPTISFGKISTTSVTSFSVAGNTFNGMPGVSFNYAFNPSPSTSNRAFIRYFLSTTPDVSNTNYQAYSSIYNFSSLSNMAGFTSNDLVGMGFTVGQTVYVRMYGDSFKSNDFMDPNTSKREFPNINNTTTTAISFVVP